MKFNKKNFFRKVGYTPQDYQWDFHNSPQHYKVPISGRRVGKSKSSGMELAYHAMDFKKPRQLIMLVGAEYITCSKEFMVMWEVIVENLKILKPGPQARFNLRQGEMYMKLPWGTEVFARSEKVPNSLKGDAIDHVLFSEAAQINETTWTERILPAVSDKNGYAYFPTTPVGKNWIYEMYRDGQLYKKDPSLLTEKQRLNAQYHKSWNLPSWSNKLVYPGGENDPKIQILRNKMPEALFKQEIGADFTSFEGKIYTDWDDDIHVREIRFNPDLPNYIGFDWGFSDAFAGVEFQIDGDGNIYVWREYYERGKLKEDCFREINDRKQPDRYHLDQGFGDCADPDAVLSATRHVVRTQADPRSKENKAQGISVVGALLKEIQVGETGEFGKPLLAPKLFVDRSCVNLIREFNNYVASPNSAGNQTIKIANAVDDHALDALRYALMHILELGYNAEFQELYDVNTVFIPTPEHLIIPDTEDILALGLENSYRNDDDEGYEGVFGSFGGELRF